MREAMGEVVKVETSEGARYVRYDWNMGAYADVTNEVLSGRYKLKPGKPRKAVRR